MTGADHIRRLDALKALRAPLESFWREAYQYTFPLRGEKIGSEALPADAVRAASSASQARIYDSTCRDSAKLLAANLMSGMTPAHVKWLGLEIN
ncbi:MAG: phage tail protein, partial [Dehalococcoidia bacterium]